MADYLSSREVAQYLRLNLKKVYALVAEGQLPAARISGKWLFPRELVDRWVAEHTVYPPGGLMGSLLDQMLVLQGSDDWLLSRVLERAAAKLGRAVPTAAVGSLGGLAALGEGRAHLASCHLAAEAIRERAPGPAYLFGLFTREQGILCRDARATGRGGLAALCLPGLRVAVRQEGSGTARLVARLLAEQGLTPAWTPVGPFSSHLEVALAVRSGAADAGVGIRVVAGLAGLDFVPLAGEEFDLAIPAAFMGHARVARFLDFAVDELGAEARAGPAGYGFAPLGRLSSLPPPPTKGPT
jgi:excisionase family DNA binding protein